MVQGKKAAEMSNGIPKYQQPNMAFPRKDGPDTRGGNTGKSEVKQNGNANSFRTDSAISGSRVQGERPLQRWVPDSPAGFDASLESIRNKSTNGGAWDQFAENKRLFGVTSDYDENIYTTTIDTSHPQYQSRLAAAERKAKEIERVAPTNTHVAEERIMDNVGDDDTGADEEDKYSGVHRQKNFPPLPSSGDKYTPPGRRPPTGQPTVSGAPVDPAIISSQLARPDKAVAEKPKAIPAAQKPTKSGLATPPTTTEASLAATPESKPHAATASSSSRNASPQVKTDGVPNATATVERDVATAFKGFAAQQRKNVEISRVTRARNDKEIKLNDLKNFANSFKLHTPVPSDLVSIIAKDPKKQKEIQEKAQRNAEEASKATSAETTKTAAPSFDSRPAQRPTAATHGSPSSNLPNRQNNGRNSGFQNTLKGPSQSQQPQPAHQSRATGNLGQRLRSIEQNKHSQMPLNPMPVHDARLPPTGPANTVDPSFSRRSSGVASAQGGRLNPNSNEFRPSPYAASFSPTTGNPSTGSSPNSAANALVPAPVARSLLRHKPISKSERPSLRGTLDALEQLKTLKPPQGKDWKLTGGLKPAYDTPPIWKQGGGPDEKEDSPIKLTYTQLFEMAPFPAQTMSPPNSSSGFPQVPHQHQLPIHLQHGAHNMGVRQSPRQPPMGLHGNQHPHGPTPPFNGHDDHRMMPSHSAQSFASPRLQNIPIAYPSPMNQPAQMYNPGMMQYPGAPPMQTQMRSFSHNQQFIPQQGPMGPIMMQNPAGSFLTSQGMAPGPQVMFPQPFMQGNGHPPPMPGVNGYPSPGRSAPMMMSQGSQHGHQQPMYGMNPGMSPGPQFGGPMYQQQQQSVQMPVRGFSSTGQFGTSPQQVHQFPPPQNRNSHANGSYNNNKNFQHQQHNGPVNHQVPTGPQTRGPEGSEEAK